MENNYSVLMPLWYKENPAYFQTSLNSIVNQTIPPFEIVFVRDHEIPNSLTNIIEEETQGNSIKIVYADAYDCFGKGLGSILARGLLHCSCPLVARMDSDDIALPDRCEKQLKKFCEDPELDIIGGTIAEFSDSPDQIVSYRKLPENHEAIIQFSKLRSPFNHPTVMFKRQAVLKAGNYNSTLSKCEDYDLWFRLLNSGAKAYNIQDVLLDFRAGVQMLERRKDKEHFAQYKALKKRMRSSGFISEKEYIFSVVGQTVFYYAPLGFKKVIYKDILRK